MHYNKFKDMPIDTTDMATLKTAGYGLATTLGVFFGLNGIKQEILTGLVALMIIDTFTGLLKYWRVDKQSIKSKSFSEGVIKKVVALLLPLVIGLITKTMGWDNTVLLTTVFSVLCLSETYSIISNLYVAYTGQHTEEFDAISAILKFTKDKIFDVLKSILKIK